MVIEYLGQLPGNYPRDVYHPTRYISASTEGLGLTRDKIRAIKREGKLARILMNHNAHICRIEQKLGLRPR